MELDSEGYSLDVDAIHLARSDDADGRFVGLLRNFYFDRHRFFDGLDGVGEVLPPGVEVDNTGEVWFSETRQPVYPVTFRGSTAAVGSYAVVTTLRVPGEGRPLSLMIGTSDPMMSDGLVACSVESVFRAGNFFAVELVDGGLLRVSADDGGGPVAVVSGAGSLADGRWHTVDIAIEQVRAAGGRRRRTRAANGAAVTVLVDNRHRDKLAAAVDLTGRLYVGGVPTSIRRRLPATIRARRGFSGCLATVVVNGRLYNIPNDATFVSNSVTAGCTSTTCLLVHFLTCILADSAPNQSEKAQPSQKDRSTRYIS